MKPSFKLAGLLAVAAHPSVILGLVPRTHRATRSIGATGLRLFQSAAAALMLALLAPVAHAQVGNPAQPFQSDPAALDAKFRTFIAALWPEARARGVSRAMFDRALGRLTPDPEIFERLYNQPEHHSTTAQYLDRLVSATRIQSGRQKLIELAPLLTRIEAAYGVDRRVVLAVWGIESGFGASTGTRSVIRSLATLAVGDERRPQYWKKELLTALVILQNGDIAPEQMTGSWAGAMGHTQFMPASYLAYAVDFDGDGRRDIWTSVPDALASTANYLKVAGWVSREPWGYEAIVPDDFDFAHASSATAKSLFDWLSLGVTPPGGRKFIPVQGALQLVLPAGARGPGFLVTRNFRALLRYNSSVSYALAVGHLGDRIAGDPALAVVWPPDRALGLTERQELQRLLLLRGLEVGSVDGRIGGQTKDAIRAFQRARGLPEDGHPGPDLLERLRRDTRS